MQREERRWGLEVWLHGTWIEEMVQSKRIFVGFGWRAYQLLSCGKASQIVRKSGAAKSSISQYCCKKIGNVTFTEAKGQITSLVEQSHESSQSRRNIEFYVASGRQCICV